MQTLTLIIIFILFHDAYNNINDDKNNIDLNVKSLYKNRDKTNIYNFESRLFVYPCTIKRTTTKNLKFKRDVVIVTTIKKTIQN